MKQKLSTLLYQRIKLSGVLFLAPFLFGVPFASAATYQVAPVVIEHDVAARDMLEESIKLTNTGDTTVKIFPSVHVISLGQEGEIKAFESPVMTDQTKNVTSWLAISRARLELAPGETVKLPLSITVHPQAVPGEYYAYIGFGTGDKRKEAEAEVLRGNAPGTVVRLSLADKNNEYLRLHSFVVDRYVTSQAGSPVTYELENIGDTSVSPRGEIIIYDVRGAEVATLLIDQTEALKPGERKTYENILPDTGAYGRHKAYLNLEYGTTMRANLYDTTFFTVVPLRLIFILFGLLISVSLLLTLLYWYKERKRNHYDDEAVPLFVRSGLSSNTKDHDINLKDN